MKYPRDYILSWYQSPRSKDPCRHSLAASFSSLFFSFFFFYGKRQGFKKLGFLLSAVSYSLDHTDVRLDTVASFIVTF